MDDLVERIKASVEDQSSDPWFPELTDELTVAEWGRLNCDIGLTPNNYGTGRVLCRSVSAPRAIIASLKKSSSSDAPTISIEAAQQEWADSYRKAGVSFYSADEILDTTLLSCVQDAIVIINQVPSLRGTIDSLVRSLHLIEPVNVDLDVSFSEPHVPFSIFVSVPQERIANDALRVAEAIVHEAMHLQLTLIERTAMLYTANNEKRYFSPWRQEQRTAQGILHGLYVFVVIERFLRSVRSSGQYLAERCIRIAEEISEIRAFQNSPDLTPLGDSLVRRLLGSL
jgi:hypothetical protein